jgi:hypothetical protein
MSEQQKKTYVNGIFVKSTQTAYGDIIKLSIKTDDLVEFFKQHQNNGWVNIDLLKKREVDEKGRTHTAVLNSWTGNVNKTVDINSQSDESDLPF